jgi:hypothetical protein
VGVAFETRERATVGAGAERDGEIERRIDRFDTADGSPLAMLRRQHVSVVRRVAT